MTAIREQVAGGTGLLTVLQEKAINFFTSCYSSSL